MGLPTEASKEQRVYSIGAPASTRHGFSAESVGSAAERCCLINSARTLTAGSHTAVSCVPGMSHTVIDCDRCVSHRALESLYISAIFVPMACRGISRQRK